MIKMLVCPLLCLFFSGHTTPHHDTICHSKSRTCGHHDRGMHTHTAPDLRPAKTSSNVVFPAPLGPINAVTVEGFAIPEILCSNCFSSDWPKQPCGVEERYQQRTRPPFHLAHFYPLRLKCKKAIAGCQYPYIIISKGLDRHASQTYARTLNFGTHYCDLNCVVNLQPATNPARASSRPSPDVATPKHPGTQQPNWLSLRAPNTPRSPPSFSSHTVPGARASAMQSPAQTATSAVDAALSPLAAHACRP